MQHSIHMVPGAEAEDLLNIQKQSMDQLGAAYATRIQWDSSSTCSTSNELFACNMSCA
jgi:hypothetical protein